ncbi:hypothetical protein AAULR_24746, partial [Lacticaseibacillus rhamnosus MTCC 5462]
VMQLIMAGGNAKVLLLRQLGRQKLLILNRLRSSLKKQINFSGSA